MKVPKPRKLSSGNYYIQLRLGGQNVNITAADPTECQNKAALVKAEYLNGKRIETSTNRKTLGQIIDDYIRDNRNVLSPSTIRGYETIRNNRFQAYMNKQPANINWQAMINREISAQVSAKTIKNSWALVAASLKYARITVPEDINLPQVMPATREWLDADQVKVFVKAVHNADCEIPALLALHSLRRSEIMGLTWEKVDLVKEQIRIDGSAVFNEENQLTYKSTNKTKKSRRTIPIMIPELTTALKKVPEDKRTGYIVTCNPNTIWSQINRVCRANDLPEVGVHGLRHSFASLAHHVGLPEQDTMLIGGWEDAQTMHKIYEHISAADKAKSQNRIANFFLNAN